MTDLQKIYAISGYPGLFRHLSKGRNGVIVESMLDGKRMNTGGSMRVTALSDVAIYTNTEELPLRDALVKIREKQNGAAAIDHKSSPGELRKFFEEILPDYDRERFYASHMKKVAEWYNLLQKNNLLDFAEAEAEEKDDKKEETPS
ncbi:MAG: DUF5606 domain-containing protein [Prevotellaceae bacterium]|jgi:hypothetical protein|nr:DUF5606 domain-containing protein [Prevotellaceae bacterium]